MSGIDWPGLLKWSLAHADGTSDACDVSADDVKFLQEAIQHAMSQVKDPHEAVKESLVQVTDKSDETKLAGLNIISKCLDEAPEVSRNLAKLGAVDPLFACLNADSPDVVLAALDCFAFALPNNQALQDSLQQQSGLMRFCACLRESSSRAMSAEAAIVERWRDVQVKCMGCLASLVRNNEKSTAAFVRRGGLVWITFALKSSNWRLHQKVFTFATYLLGHATIPADTLANWVAAVSVVVATQLYVEIGQQHGELMAQFLQALVPAVADKGKLAALADLCRARITRLKALTEANMAADQAGDDCLDDYSVEVDLLSEVVSSIDALQDDGL